jgi:hypothetical protein
MFYRILSWIFAFFVFFHTLLLLEFIIFVIQSIKQLDDASKSFRHTDRLFKRNGAHKRARVSSRRRFDIATYEDLLHYYPYRHVVKSKIYKIAQISGESSICSFTAGWFVMKFWDSSGPKRLVAYLMTARELWNWCGSTELNGWKRY